MGDEEDQEPPFQEMDAHQLAAQTAWVRLLIREPRKRGYTIEDVVALLDEPRNDRGGGRRANSVFQRAKGRLGRSGELLAKESALLKRQPQ